MKTEADVFRLYQETFLKIYGDLIAVTGKKPVEVLEQLEHCFAHFAVAKTTHDSSLAQKNLDKAYDHILRASLDTAKLLWTIFREKTIGTITDGEMIRFCSNASEGPVGELYTQYKKAENDSMNARRNEANRVGLDPEPSILEWYNAALEYRRLDKIFLKYKIQSFREKERKKSILNKIIIVLVALVTLVIGVFKDAILTWFLPAAPPNVGKSTLFNKIC